MWHKKHRQQDPQAPPGKRLRDNLVDLYASGEVAGERAQSLLDDAGDFAKSVGHSEFQDLVGGRSEGSQKNKDRDLRRRLLRRSHWPPVYTAQVRCYSLRQKCIQPQSIALLLPHELIGVLEEVGDSNIMCQHGALDVWNEAKHANIMTSLQVPFVSLSLWGDGVPFSWDRKRSLDMWVLSFPGLEDKALRDLRLVLTALPHECVVRETQDDLLSILAWSFQSLANGHYPTERHDGQAWGAEDSWRGQKSGQRLLHAALLEIKGDWKQLHSCFAVPYWRRSPEKPLCWRCNCSKQSLATEAGGGSICVLSQGWGSSFKLSVCLLDAETPYLNSATGNKA